MRFFTNRNSLRILAAAFNCNAWVLLHTRSSATYGTIMQLSCSLVGWCRFCIYASRFAHIRRCCLSSPCGADGIMFLHICTYTYFCRIGMCSFVVKTTRCITRPFSSFIALIMHVRATGAPPQNRVVQKVHSSEFNIATSVRIETTVIIAFYVFHRFLLCTHVHVYVPDDFLVGRPLRKMVESIYHVCTHIFPKQQNQNSTIVECIYGICNNNIDIVNLNELVLSISWSHLNILLNHLQF